jgi:hypothetical protein
MGNLPLGIRYNSAVIDAVKYALVHLQAFFEFLFFKTGIVFSHDGPQ